VRSFFADCLQKLFFMGLTYYQIAFLSFLPKTKIIEYFILMFLSVGTTAYLFLFIIIFPPIYLSVHSIHNL
jgi:hypothetical protein